MPGARYEQTMFRVTPVKDRCNPADTCPPQEIKVTYKTTEKAITSFDIHYLLRPGNISVLNNCSGDCKNVGSQAPDTFDIRDGKIITNFATGTVYTVYYINEYDINQYQLVPDNIRIKDYIKACLKYKMFETIYNQVTDETFNQVQSKFQYYTSMYYEAKVMAEIEIKKQTIHQVQNSIQAQKNRFRKYKIK